jgi:peptide/nickel transport system ATP-binding protein
MRILETKDLCRVFAARRGRQVHALGPVSFSIESGQAFGLVGGSGSGKSTLALCILRLIEPTSGNISFMGMDWLALKGKQLKALRRRMQPIFQDPDSSLNPLFRIGRAIEEPLLAHRIGGRAARQSRTESLITKVGLRKSDLNRYPEELSGGQRQRVAIARALAPEPSLLVADEPVSFLDAATQLQILRLLGDLKEEFGLTTLFISHDLATVAEFCDVTAVIRRGQLVEMGKTKRLFEDPRHPYTRALLKSAKGGAAESVQHEPGASLIEVEPGYFVAQA